MSDYETLTRRLQELKNQQIRLATQLEELQKQEAIEVSKLTELGVVDADDAVNQIESRLTVVTQQIEEELRALGV